LDVIWLIGWDAEKLWIILLYLAKIICDSMLNRMYLDAQRWIRLLFNLLVQQKEQG